MAGLVGRVVFRQVLPLGAGLQCPEDTFQYLAVVLPGTAAGFQTLEGCDKRSDDAPLLVGERHGQANYG